MIPRYGREVSRIEGFSDAVLAFALTLLVVSLEVPHTYEELMATMKGFVPFAICFALLMQIWFKHYGFFRRYGLQDPSTRVLNAVLLFIVLFYVYPLKFLWSNLVIRHAGEGATGLSQGRVLMVIYGLGGAAVFSIFVLLHLHAWRLRDDLELNELERFDTRAAIRENVLLTAVPALSILLAVSLPDRLVSLAGLVYFVYAPLMTWNGMRDGKNRRILQQSVEIA